MLEWGKDTMNDNLLKYVFFLQFQKSVTGF